MGLCSEDQLSLQRCLPKCPLYPPVRSLSKTLRNWRWAEWSTCLTLGSDLEQSMRPIVSASVSLSGSLTVLRWGCVCVVLMCVSVVGVNLSVVAFLVESRIGCLVLL